MVLEELTTRVRVDMYTTAASGVFGLISRIREYIQAPAWVLALMLVAIMAPLTMFGFSNWTL